MNPSHDRPRRLRRFACAAFIAVANAAAGAQTVEVGCGSLDNAYGPYDYRTAKARLPIVERHHFTPQVEALIRGNTGSLGSDLDYTLRAFPNHHRALIALMRASEKARSPQPYGLPRPVECYFDRALRFRPEDALTRMIYARFLVDKERAAEARQQLEAAKRAAGDNGFSQYNIGLIYLDLKDYPQALAQAHKAAALGFTQTGLKDKLKALGKWDEKALPTPAAQPSAPAASAAAPG
jgi:tetratricopeptide (TPR) repeat protein